MYDYTDFPPVEYFVRSLRNNPQSTFLYSALWKQKPLSNRLSIRRKDIKKKFDMSYTIFRNQLLSLDKLELLSFEERIDYFLIDFVDNEKN